MSKNKFTISFKQTTKDMKILAAIKEIEEQERSQAIKDILFNVLVKPIEQDQNKIEYK